MDFSTVIAIAAPEAVLGTAILVLLSLGAFAGPKSSAMISWLAVAGLIGAAVTAAVSPLGSVFAGGFVSDQAAVFAKVAIYGMSAVGVILGHGWLGRLGARQFE